MLKFLQILKFTVNDGHIWLYSARFDSFHIYGFALKWNIVSVHQFGSSLGPRICLLKEQNWIRMWENGKLIVLDVVEKVPFQLLLIIVITNIFIVITSVIVEITTVATITKWMAAKLVAGQRDQWRPVVRINVQGRHRFAT